MIIHYIVSIAAIFVALVLLLGFIHIARRGVASNEEGVILFLLMAILSILTPFVV